MGDIICSFPTTRRMLTIFGRPGNCSRCVLLDLGKSDSSVRFTTLPSLFCKIDRITVCRAAEIHTAHSIFGFSFGIVLTTMQTLERITRKDKVKAHKVLHDAEATRQCRHLSASGLVRDTYQYRCSDQIQSCARQMLKNSFRVDTKYF